MREKNKKEGAHAPSFFCDGPAVLITVGGSASVASRLLLGKTRKSEMLC